VILQGQQQLDQSIQVSHLRWPNGIGGVGSAKGVAQSNSSFLWRMAMLSTSPMPSIKVRNELPP
jgi:hypothetical protein